MLVGSIELDSSTGLGEGDESRCGLLWLIEGSLLLKREGLLTTVLLLESFSLLYSLL